MTMRLLLISGSLRSSSGNSAVLRTSADVAPSGIECAIYAHLAALPAFNPDTDEHPLEPEVKRLRDEIHSADAILFSVPEYAGALPGAFKNLLDWTIGDEQARSILDKPVGWVNSSPRGAEGAYRELRTVLSYAHANIVDGACVDIPMSADAIGPDGLIEDGTIRSALIDVLARLLDAATV